MKNKVLVTRSSMPSFEEYTEQIKGLWDSHWLTNMGALHQELENALEQYLKVDNVSLFTNGHLALELGIQALDLKGEVITTPFTFASTTHAIVRNGLKPVFCDIREADGTMDVTKIESLITSETAAILPVHVYGNICDIEAIEQIAKKHDLKVIYDAAHAFGETYKGVGVANFGDFSMFSFHATKVFNTIEGGALTFHDDAMKNKLYGLKNFGIRSEEVVDMVGSNAKMNEFQAAMGLCNLKHVDDEIQKRKKVVTRYKEKLSGVCGIRFMEGSSQTVSNYAYFPIVVDENRYGMSRDVLSDKLKEHDIMVRKYFSPLTSTFDCYKDSFDVQATPIALKVSNGVITLPLYADLPLSTVDEICDLIIGLGK